MIESGFFAVVLCLQGMCNAQCPQTQEHLGAVFSCYNCLLISLAKISLLSGPTSVLGAIILTFV